MTLDEALQVLGVERGVDHKTARRAYLRGIKKHKPEQDPEGFQRLREAWELAQHFLPKQPREPRSRSAAPPPIAPRIAPPVADGDGDPVPAPVPDPVPDPVPAAPAATGPTRTPEPLSSPDPDPDPVTVVAPPPPPVTVPPTVTAVTPDPEPDPDPPLPLDPWELHDRLFDSIADADGPATLDWARQLFTHHPDDVAGAALVEACRDLYAVGQIGPASTLVDQLTEWIEDHGGELKALPGHARLDWILVGELSSIADLLPRDLVARIATGVRDGDPGSRPILVAARAVAANDPALARQVLTRLQTGAPSLLELIGPAFEYVVRGAPLSDDGVSGSSFRLGCGAWFAAYVVIRLLLELGKALSG